MHLLDQIITKIICRIAKFCLKLDCPSMAVTLLQKAIATYPLNRDLYFTLADAYKYSRQWNESINVLKKAIALLPNDLNIYWAFGLWLLQLGYPGEALNYIQAYLEKGPHKDDKYKLANIYAIRGQCLVLLEQWDDAEKSLQTSRSLARWDLDGCIGTVGLFICTDRSEYVVNFLEEYIKNLPDLYPPYVWMAHHLQYSLRRPVDSLELYRKALQKITDPEARKYCDQFVQSVNMFDDLLDEYVDALLASGQSHTVLPEIQKYEKYKIGSAIESKLRLINFYIETKDLKKAESIANIALKSYKRSPEIYSSLAHLEMNKDEFEKALNIVQRALLLDEEYPEALGILGDIQVKTNKWNDAILTYKKLISRAPFVADWLKSLGLCYFHLDQLENAQTYYEKCVKYDPLDADAWVELGEIYSLLGQNELAYSSCERAISFNRLTVEKREQAEKILERRMSKK